MKSVRLVVVLMVLGLPLFFSSCATVGKKFPEQKVPTITVGETTRSEIQEMFGDPWRTGLENGKETWSYGYYKFRVFQNPENYIAHDLTVRFDDQGIVENYSFTAN